MRSLVAVYLLACSASLAAYLGVLGPIGGTQHDPHTSGYAIILAMPWSLAIGLLLHPDMKLGLVILMLSQLLNAGLLFHFLTRFSQR